ncbi:MAG TPA: gamma-glutamyl-gamma-aminobutyrate hydrolase family protein [Candidatus Limnocylindrales bacterium]|nr:gamma-glutamyl-gamma-aminobutyrate hydrolase family protein [Candidatus Limnocylindrales bacterium]
MKRPPLILISPDVESAGKEFGDLSTSLSAKYEQALIVAGGIPVTMPATDSRDVIAECVRVADGVLLTGGDDVNPELYGNGLPEGVSSTIEITPDGGKRDYRELLLIGEVFQQCKPLLAICRGQQILNVALGGTLVADIPSQVPDALEHRRADKRGEIVHEVQLTAGSLLAKITGGQKLGVNSTHHQAVAQVAAPLRSTAVSEDGVIEGLELKPEGTRWLPFLLSVQFHPERLMDRYPEHEAIFRMFTRACGQNRKKHL